LEEERAKSQVLNPKTDSSEVDPYKYYQKKMGKKSESEEEEISNDFDAYEESQEKQEFTVNQENVFRDKALTKTMNQEPVEVI